MSYGDFWGGFWGGGPSFFESLMISRLLQFTRGDAIFPHVVRLFAARAEALLEQADNLAEAFALETATGDRLDKIGGILQASRQGLEDDLYRRLLQVHIRSILSSAATAETLISIAEVWSESIVTSYTEYYPATALMDIVEEPENTDFLLQLLHQAKGGGVALILAVFEPDLDALIMDDVVTPLDDLTVLDSVGPGAPIANVGYLPVLYEI